MYTTHGLPFKVTPRRTAEARRRICTRPITESRVNRCIQTILIFIERQFLYDGNCNQLLLCRNDPSIQSTYSALHVASGRMPTTHLFYPGSLHLIM